MQLSLADSMVTDAMVLQEESDAQYKNKGKKGSKVDIRSTADAASKDNAAPTTASGTSTTAADADKDVEMVDAPGASSSGEKKHVGELTGESAIPQQQLTQQLESMIAAHFAGLRALCVNMVKTCPHSVLVLQASTSCVEC